MAALFLRAVLAAAVGSTAHADAPRLTAEVDTAEVRLGDPVTLHLRVERPASSRSLFPELPEQLGSWVVRSQAAPTTSAGPAGVEVDEGRYELAAYALDAGPIPALEVLVVTASDTSRLTSSPIPMQILSARDPEEGDALRAIKPPLTIPGGIPLWLAGVLAALAAVLVAWLVSRFLRRPEKKPAPASRPPPRAPVDYEREFTRIAESGLLQRGAVKLYYTRLSDVMRRFLEDRLSVDSLDRTTSEIAADLRRAPAPPDEGTREGIIGFLMAADLVKFARAEPPFPEAAAAPEEGRRLVAGAGEQPGARMTPAAPSGAGA